jgi:hypothetical protein
MNLTQLTQKQRDLIQSTKNALRNDIELFQRHLDLQKNCIVSHNFVIEVGAYTITTKEDRTIDHRFSNKLPSTWTEKGVQEVTRLLREAGEDREIKVQSLREFLTTKIQSFKDTLGSMPK